LPTPGKLPGHSRFKRRPDETDTRVFEFLDLLYIYRRFASFIDFSVTMLRGGCVGVKTEKPTGDGGLRQVSKK
jgi:hypothetical protein